MKTLKVSPGLWLLALLALFSLGACGDDENKPSSAVCPMEETSCPNLCTGGTGVLGESCASPSDCACGLFCGEGRCMPYQGELEGCTCSGGIAPEFPAPPERPTTVTTCTANTVGHPCEDGNVCTQTGTCNENRECVANPITYAAACDDGNPCTTRDTCAGSVCLGIAREDGASCEDGDLCSGIDTCVAGICQAGSPPDCTEWTDSCNTGSCDPETGACIATPVTNGTSCDDTSLCTDNDLCEDGACVGTARDCSNLDEACTRSLCNPENGLCEPENLEDGASCEDGDLCTLEDTCLAGVCTPGSPHECNNPCITGTCNPENGQCEGPPVEDGTSCDDENTCTLEDTCVQGACIGQRDTCFCEGMPDGTGCDDFDPCTLDSACQGGTCQGTRNMDCSSLTNACNVGFCDAETGECAQTPVLPGTPCDDGDLCTHNDACIQGTCAGDALDCSNLTEGCQAGTCNPENGQCESQNLPDGSSCNTGDTCTLGETCQAGECTGGENQCDACENLPPGSACDDGDPCTLEDTCLFLDGIKACQGEAMDCTHLDEGCQVGQCDPNTAMCVPAPADNGRSCDDQNDCTHSDQCSAGTCQGEPFPTCDGQPNLCEPFTEINTPQNARVLTLGQEETIQIRGRVEIPGESDWYALELGEDERITALTSSDCGSELDTLLALRQSDGQTLVASNDDSPGSTWASLQEIAVPQPGLYYLQVRSFANNQSSYLLHITRQEPPRCASDEECGCAHLVCGEENRCVSPLPQEAEPNGTYQEGTPIALLDEASGELDSPTDVDWFKVNLESGVPINIVLDSFCADPVDTELRLFAPNGTTTLFYNDDAPGAVTSALSAIVPQETGEHFIQIRGHNMATGAYRVRLEDARCRDNSDCACADQVCSQEAGGLCVPGHNEVEPNDSFQEAQIVQIAQKVVARIEAPRASDVFAIDLPPGRYTVETSGLCEGGGDTQLEFFSSDGTLLSEDDNGGAGRFSKLEIHSTSPGRHFVRVRWYGLGQGDYTLTVSPTP